MSRGLRVLQSLGSAPEQTERHANGPDLLTQVQLCARLGISDETFRRWRQCGRAPLPVLMPSGRLKWRRQDIDRMAGALADEQRITRETRLTKKFARVAVLAHGKSLPETSAVSKADEVSR